MDINFKVSAWSARSSLISGNS